MVYVGIWVFWILLLILCVLVGDVMVFLVGGEVKFMISLVLGDKVFLILCLRVIYVKCDMLWFVEVYQLVGFGCDFCGLVFGWFLVGFYVYECFCYIWNCYYLQLIVLDIMRFIMFELGIL